MVIFETHCIVRQKGGFGSMNVARNELTKHEVLVSFLLERLDKVSLADPPEVAEKDKAARRSR